MQKLVILLGSGGSKYLLVEAPDFSQELWMRENNLLRLDDKAEAIQFLTACGFTVTELDAAFIELKKE